MQNNILDYKQMLKKLKMIEENSNNRIKQEEPIGMTAYGLPISHYTVGNGKNHIVLAGAQHGCEIITTDFLIKAMEEIGNGDNKFDFLNNGNYTLHFLPTLNPEGYLISTYAIRRVIKREMPDDEAQDVYQDYLEAYQKDDEDAKRNIKLSHKRHQQYFGHISPDAIFQKKYRDISKKLHRIYRSGKVPEGTLVTWHSNGNGVDLNQNTPFNPKIKAKRSGEKLYAAGRYDNIETTRLGPIGCPMQGEKFEYEPENKALMSFLLNLKNNEEINLCAFLNYHSAGGMAFYKPYKNPEEVIDYNVMPHMNLEAVYNKKIAEIYCDKAKYRVVESEPTLTCFNDLLRLQIPGDILIELSKKGANPIGPYVDTTYNDTIKDNMEALSYTLEKIPELNKIKQEYIENLENKTNMKSDKTIDFER